MKKKFIPVWMLHTMIRSTGPGRLRKEEDLEPGAAAKKAKEDLLAEIKTQSTTIIEAAMKKFKDDLKMTEQLDALKESIKGLTAKSELEALKTELTALGLIVKGLKEIPTSKEEGQKAFGVALKEAFAEKTVADEIQKILAAGGKQSGPMRVTVKSAVTMQVDNTIEAVGSVSHVSITTATGIISTIRKRILTYMANVSIGQVSVDRPYAMWMDEVDEQGTPIFIGEGDAKTQLSVRYEEREKKAKKIAVYGKVSTEMMRFLPQLISYIQNNLMRRMDIKIEDQLFTGNDTGDNLKGLTEYAVAFDGGVGVAGGAGLVSNVATPTNYDVIRAIALQVFNSYGVAGLIFLTPDELAKMDVEKDLNGQYILPPFRTANGTEVAGVKLVPTNALSGSGYDFIGGDMSVVNVCPVFETSITIGLDGSDFTTNKKTMLVEQELVQFVSANDVNVLVKGTFAAAKLIIELPTEI